MVAQFAASQREDCEFDSWEFLCEVRMCFPAINCRLMGEEPEPMQTHNP